jgi:hypothetical protein
LANHNRATAYEENGFYFLVAGHEGAFNSVVETQWVGEGERATTILLKFTHKKKVLRKQHLSKNRGNALPFVVSFVGHSQTATTACTARSQNATTIGRSHALTESVLVLSFPVGGLERAFHGSFVFYVSGGKDRKLFLIYKTSPAYFFKLF